MKNIKKYETPALKTLAVETSAPIALSADPGKDTGEALSKPATMQNDKADDGQAGTWQE